MKNWGIPVRLQKKVRARDRRCVYCQVKFSSSKGNRKRNATWEHINNDRWNDQSIMSINIARCCGPCNSSKGTKSLREWLALSYCKERNINQKTVSEL